MFIWRFLVLMLLASLTGCVSIQPMTAEQLASLRAGKTAVFAYDSSKKITYTDQTFYGVGVAIRDTKATYEGFLDIEPMLSENFAKLLNQRGVKATPLTYSRKAIDAGFTEKYFTPPVIRFGSEPSNIETKQTLPSFLKEAAAAGDYNYAFLVSSSGPSVTTNNFSSKEAYISSSADVYLYNAKSGALVWSGAYWLFAHIIKYKESPKEVEEDNFAALVPAIEKHVEWIFTHDAIAQKGLDTGMGLKPGS